MISLPLASVLFFKRSLVVVVGAVDNFDGAILPLKSIV
jgi:hypothetical protein